VSTETPKSRRDDPEVRRNVVVQSVVRNDEKGLTEKIYSGNA
jgi:hypothetical protein